MEINDTHPLKQSPSILPSLPFLRKNMNPNFLQKIKKVKPYLLYKRGRVPTKGWLQEKCYLVGGINLWWGESENLVWVILLGEDFFSGAEQIFGNV